MSKIIFDPTESGCFELARVIVLERLREDAAWRQYDLSGEGFVRFVEYVGDPGQGRQKLVFFVHDIMWELMIQGVIAPGLDVHNPNLPWFHLTEYGKRAILEKEFPPHDPAGYLERFRGETNNFDSTVEAYLSESLNCFTRGSLVASIVMLGVASERIFLLLCEAFLRAVSSKAEEKKLQQLLAFKAIKPKMDWIFQKIQSIQSQQPRPLPENVNIILIAIFDFIRCQRNDLGHPRETPPKISREEAYVNLRIFPTYFKMVIEVIDYLSKNKV